MKIEPENLLASGYVLADTVDHDKLAPFLRASLYRLNPVSLFYFSFNLLAFAAFGRMLLAEQRIPKLEAVLQAFLGVFCFLVILLPLHELIHGVLYKLVGATKVTFTARWRQFIFYVMASRFVASGREFTAVALAPFFLINALLVALIAVASAKLMWVCFGALLLHTGGCFGDFGLVSYFYRQRQLNPCTYDDAESQQTLFYIKPTGRRR